MSEIRRKITLVLLATLFGLSFIDRIVIALIAEQIKAEFSISDFEIGLLGGTSFAIVIAIGTIPLARLAERRSRKWVAAGTVLIGSIFTVLCGWTTSFAQFFMLRTGMAVGCAGIEPPAHSMISDMYPPSKRASAMSLYLLGLPLAAVVGSALGGWVAQSYGWRATFLLMGLLGIVGATATLLVAREPERLESARDGASDTTLKVLKIMLANPSLRHLLASVSIIGLASFGINSFLPVFFARVHNLDPGMIGLVFGTLAGVSTAVGTVLGGFGGEILSRRSPGWLVGLPGLGMVIGAPIFILGLFQQHLPLAFLLMLVGSVFFYSALGPIVISVHGALDSRSRATGSALLLLMITVAGQALGPPLAGFVSDIVSSQAYGATDFAVKCLGTAGQVQGSSCAHALAYGIRFAITCSACLYVWAGLHLLLGARHRTLLAQGNPDTASA